MVSNSAYKYQVGGSLEQNAPSYVVRLADEDFYQTLKASEFCYVLNSRQMGKSSLRVQVMRRLQADGVGCSVIDITTIGTYEIACEEWYLGIVRRLARSFRTSVKPLAWWNEREGLSPVQRLGEFIEEVLLVEIPSKIVIFIDEIDSILNLSFKDDFFALIRSCYNQRAEKEEYLRLTFALLGVTTPSDLIQDKSRTPFNIGKAIDLKGFQLQEALPLARGLENKVENPQQVLREILTWTGGQPFLTQKLCQVVATSPFSIAAGSEAELIEQLVRSRIIENWETQDKPEHLKTIRDRILNNEQRAGRLLGIYQQILQQGEILTDDSPEQIELRLSGLVVDHQGKLKVYNRIYELVFNLNWTSKALAKLRPYAPALEAWFTSNKDESWLLTGQALLDAQVWADNKSLSDLDYQFLAASQKLSKREVEIALDTERQAKQRLAEAQRKAELALDTERQANQRLAKAQQKTKWQMGIGAAVLGLSLVGAVVVVGHVNQKVKYANAALNSANSARDAAQQRVKAATEQEIAATNQAENAKKQQQKAELERKKADQSLAKAKVDQKAFSLKAQQAYEQLKQATQRLEIAHKEAQRAKQVQQEAERKATSAEQRAILAEHNTQQANHNLAKAKADLETFSLQTQQANEKLKQATQGLEIAHKEAQRAKQVQQEAEKKATSAEQKAAQAEHNTQQANQNLAKAKADLEVARNTVEGVNAVIAEIQGKFGNLIGKARTLTNIGEAYSSIGEPRKALEYFNQALPIFKQASGSFAGEGTTLSSIGKIYSYLGEQKKALEYYGQALPIHRKQGDRAGEATTLGNLGNAYLSLGDYNKAIDYQSQSLAIARAIRDQLGESHALGNLGDAYDSLGDYKKAIDYQSQSLAIARAIGNRPRESISLNNLGNTYLHSGNPKAAEENLRAAITVDESIRKDLGNNDAFKISIFETQAGSYRLLQQALVAQSRPLDALLIAERGRAQALIELVAGRLGLSSTTVGLTMEQIQHIAQQQNATLVEYSFTSDELYIWVIKPTGEVAFNRVNLKKTEIGNLAEDTRVAAATLAEGRGTANQFITSLVSKTRSSLNPTPSTSAQPTTSTVRPLSCRGNVCLQLMYQLLIRPIEKQLPTNPNAHVIFIPHQSLFLVSFAALQDQDGQFLIEKHTISIAPSIQVLQLSHQQKLKLQTQQSAVQNSFTNAAKTALVVGNPIMPKVLPKIGEPPQQLPDLPGAQLEAQNIGKVLNTPVLTKEQASKEAVKKLMLKASIIHLATHGLLDNLEEPGIPGVVVLAPSKGDDGLLSANEVLNLQLNAQLVVLSTGNSAIGRITEDSVLGFPRALITAGVPSIIVSLWQVSDQNSTVFLMPEFYRQWKNNPDKARALRAAMLATMKKYPNPSDWAAFVFIGEAD